MPVIEIAYLNKIYHIKKQALHALKNIHLSVARGEIVGVIGKSGAGKSTLIRCVNLLERPTSGSVCINGVDLMTLNARALRQARHQIGMVFQHFNLLETRTVFKNVAFPLELLKKNKKQIEATVMPLLEKVGLHAHRDYYPKQLSGGQKQRVAIARALATNPQVLLCDEMTSALDPETTEDILNLLQEINQEFQLSILYITHEMQVIKSIADRVAVIDHGAIIECESLVNLFKNPKTDIAKRFTESVLKAKLPATLQTRLKETASEKSSVILRLIFFGSATLSPIVNDFMQHTAVRANILEAHIEHLRHELIGNMLLCVELTNITLEKIKNFLNEKDVQVEVVGYVD